MRKFHTLSLAVFFLLTAINPLSFAAEKDWLIIPGKSAGPIKADMSEAELIQIYGKTNIRSFNNIKPMRLFGEHAKSQTETRLFPNNPEKRISILWHDIKENKSPRHFNFRGSKSLWKTSHGITIGLTLRELEKKNGKAFIVSGFDWDQGGKILSWKNGLLEELGDSISLELDYSSCAAHRNKKRSFSKEDLASVTGGRRLKSNNESLQKINPCIKSIDITF